MTNDQAPMTNTSFSRLKARKHTSINPCFIRVSRRAGMANLTYRIRTLLQSLSGAFSIHRKDRFVVRKFPANDLTLVPAFYLLTFLGVGAKKIAGNALAGAGDNRAVVEHHAARVAEAGADAVFIVQPGLAAVDAHATDQLVGSKAPLVDEHNPPVAQGNHLAVGFLLNDDRVALGVGKRPHRLPIPTAIF